MCNTVCVCVKCVARSSPDVAPKRSPKSAPKITAKNPNCWQLTKSRMFVDLHLITRNWLIGVHVSVCPFVVQVSDVPVPSASHLE